MSEANHTPGPWVIGKWDSGKIIDSQGFLGIHGEANARLISTAPDGLALAKSVVELYGSLPVNPDAKEWHAIVAQARALIAKAEGGKP